MSDPRICIIGAGRLSSRRIYPYIGAAGAQLVGVCDLDGEKAATNARRFGGTPYTDMDAMLAAEKPDGVIICVGPEGHARLAPLVLKRGIPVYTEKPPAPSAADALAVARAAKEAGVLCMTAFKKRYAACYQRAKEWLASFPEDQHASLSIDYASGGYGEKGEGFLLDFAIHAIDLVGYLMGDVKRVACFARQMDAYAVALEFASGAVGTMNLTRCRSFMVPTEEVELTVKGGNFMTIHNSSSWRLTAGEKPGEWREPPTFISAGDSGNDTGHLAEITEFVTAIQEGRSTRSQVYESYKSMVLFEAIRDAAAAGKMVDVSYKEM